MINFSCPTCGHEFSVSEELAGKKQKCSCGNGIIFPDTVGIDSHPPKETIANPESMMSWDTIQVVFTPWKIPRIALRCSIWYALFVASFVLTWESQVIMYGGISGISEPFVDWQHYGSYHPDRVFQFFVIVFAVLFFILLLFTSLISKVFKINPAAIRAVLLTPTILILPSHIWAFAIFVTAVRDPSFGFGIEKPEWIYLPILTFLSASYWFFIGLITLVGVGLLNAVRATKLCRQKKLQRVGQMNLKKITLIAAIFTSLTALNTTYSFITFLSIRQESFSIYPIISWLLRIITQFSIAGFLLDFYRCQGKKE